MTTTRKTANGRKESKEAKNNRLPSDFVNIFGEDIAYAFSQSGIKALPRGITQKTANKIISALNEDQGDRLARLLETYRFVGEGGGKVLAQKVMHEYYFQRLDLVIRETIRSDKSLRLKERLAPTAIEPLAWTIGLFRSSTVDIIKNINAAFKAGNFATLDKELTKLGINAFLFCKALEKHAPNLEKQVDALSGFLERFKAYLGPSRFVTPTGSRPMPLSSQARFSKPAKSSAIQPARTARTKQDTAATEILGTTQALPEKPKGRRGLIGRGGRPNAHKPPPARP